MREYHLQINLSKLESNIDFAGLVFKLAFEDPRGIQGEANLYWNGGTIGDRVIISPKRKGECFPQFLKEQNMSF